MPSAEESNAQMTSGQGWKPGRSDAHDVHSTAKKENDTDTNQIAEGRKRARAASIYALVCARLGAALVHQMPTYARAVLEVLLAYMNGTDTCEPTVGQLATEARICVRYVQYGLRLLEDHGWISTVMRPDPDRPGYNLPNLYRILPRGRLWDRERALRAEPKPRLFMGAKRCIVSDPSSIAPPAVAAVGLSEGSAEGAAVDDLTVSDEPAGWESGRSYEGGEEGSAAEPSVDDVLGIAPGEEIQRNSPLPDGDGAPPITPPALQEAAQEQPSRRFRRPTGASPLATARVAFALRMLLAIGMDEQALSREARQLWTMLCSRVSSVELLLCALSALSRQRAQAMLSEGDNVWKRNEPSEVARYLSGTLQKLTMPTYTMVSALYWEGDPSCPWKAEHDAAVARGETYGEPPPAILPRHDPYKQRPFRDHLRRAVDHSRIGAQVDEMPDPSPSIANECARLILAAFAATYHDVRSLADLADDVALANRLAQRSESACAGGTLTTEDVLAVVRHFGTIQAFDQKRTGIAKAGPQLTSYLSKQLRAAKRGCAATLTLQTKAAKYIEVRPKISTAQPSGGLAHLNREKKPLTPEEITALRKSLERKIS